MILSVFAEKMRQEAKDDFKGRHSEAGLTLQAVGCYLRHALSSRNLEEMLLERWLPVDHSTINRWVLAYAPLLEKRLRRFRKIPCGPYRIDETYVRIKDRWRFLYRAIDKHGKPVDSMLSAKRDGMPPGASSANRSRKCHCWRRAGLARMATALLPPLSKIAKTTAFCRMARSIMSPSISNRGSRAINSF